jgi:hypothetical protein
MDKEGGKHRNKAKATAHEEGFECLMMKIMEYSVKDLKDI